MKTWRRAPIQRRCGFCGKELPVGTPMCVYEIGRVVRLRCAACEGAAPPPELPALSVVAADASQTTRGVDDPPRGRQRAPLDWKERAAHEREPGMEG